MAIPSDEELLSAYLDGELTAEEEAHVEHRLGSDPRYQQLHDQLRNLRTVLDSLPRRKAPAHLAGRIAQELSTAGKPSRVLPDSERAPINYRRWLWPAAAIAAAVCFSLSNPEPPVPKEATPQVASKSLPSSGSLSAAPPAMSAVAAADAAHETAREATKAAPVDYPVDDALLVECDLAAPSGVVAALVPLLQAEAIALKASAEGDEAPTSLVWFEAHPEQVRQLLTHLQQDANRVLTLQITPAPRAAAQTELAQFSRAPASAMELLDHAQQPAAVASTVSETVAATVNAAIVSDPGALARLNDALQTRDVQATESGLARRTAKGAPTPVAAVQASPVAPPPEGMMRVVIRARGIKLP